MVVFNLLEQANLCLQLFHVILGGARLLSWIKMH